MHRAMLRAMLGTRGDAMHERTDVLTDVVLLPVDIFPVRYAHGQTAEIQR